ncbi:MAG: hypothetical protein AB7Q81_03815 [Gammaproteobacteria bacterium]
MNKRRLLALCLVLLLSACSRVPVPKLPRLGGGDDAKTTAAQATAATVDQTATPRDMLTAHLVNPRLDPATPNMTVGKLIEYADRYLACDCAATRFVRRWERTAEGYRLETNSGAVAPLEFVCRDAGEDRECFLTEIDRGAQSDKLDARFVPGGEFIRFLYDNGVRCAREEPCPE